MVHVEGVLGDADAGGDGVLFVLEWSVVGDARGALHGAVC